MRKTDVIEGGATALNDEEQLTLFPIPNDDQVCVDDLIAATERDPGFQRAAITAPSLAPNELSQLASTGFVEVDADHQADPTVWDRFPSLAKHRKYRSASNKARLVEALNRCLVEGTMPRSETDRSIISRAEMASRLGVSHTLMTPFKNILSDYEVILEEVQPLASLPSLPRFGARPGNVEPMDDAACCVVRQFPSLEKHQHYPHGGTARQIVQLLNDQICSGGLQLSRGGKISRKVIAKKLGVTKSAMTVYLEILVDYEGGAEGRKSKTDQRMPEYRLWLEKSLTDGSLLLFDGKVSRKQFLGEFGLTQANVQQSKDQQLGRLLGEFDTQIAESTYQPRAVVELLVQLEQLLQDPPLRKDGLGFDRKALIAVLGISIDTIRKPPFSDALTAAEESFREQLHKDPFLALTAGRVFRFHTLVDQGWSHLFTTRLRDTFQRVYRTQTKDMAKNAFAALVDLLSYLAQSRSFNCVTVVQALSQGGRASGLSKEFALATQAYRDTLVERYENTSTRNQRVSATNIVIRNFSNEGVLPPHELGLLAFREDTKRHLRSVAEVTEATPKGRKKPHVDDYLNFATAMLKQAAEFREIEISSSDQGEFNRVLRAELEKHDFGSGNDPAKVILHVLNKRLDLIKHAATSIVVAARGNWDLGRAFLAMAQDLGDDWKTIIQPGDVGRTERNSVMRKYFPKDRDTHEQGTANLIRIVSEKYGSIYPALNLAGREEGQFFQRRAFEYGGATLIQSYLLPTQEAISATLVLYLLESGSNVSVGRTLYRDCIEESEEPNHSKVTGYKARACGKPIFVTLPDRCEAIKAMLWLREASLCTSKIIEGDENQLFIARGKNDTLKLIEEFTFRYQFTKLIGSITEFDSLTLTPNMIRPSILLKAALESDSRTGLSRAMGQHGKQVHEGYVNKYPIRYLRDTDIRLFQYSMETVVIQNIDDIHDFLNIDQQGMAERVEAVMRTGLGTMCGNRYGKPGNEGKLCQSLDCVKGCPQLILIAIPKEIAILQIWQHSLRLVEGDWVRDQPDRWEKVWLPWLCFCDAVETKMLQSFSDVWSDASDISTKLIESPEFMPMRLF
ncbi:hypothetical protein [Rhizobium ruizarguesonis]|uniref:hypothetical protein n=1 Tax=Rhizobium ruizarguesonis TaxID=2081791 RepID=UPI00102F78C8|nr:hypothetical protein [Rhizobium ruizarguesonis]TBC84265.1 hypothetical protein ELH28_16510 [Rhizobium ruizarguesonis]